ncbi:MAG: 4-alpha-glucanotransferase, partial [Alphaproteobacteria bacterium]
MPADVLDTLSAAAGIERVYVDQFGERREASAETIRALAAILGVSGADGTGPLIIAPASPLEPVAIAAIEDEAAWVNVTLAGQNRETDLYWTVEEERGAKRAGKARFIDCDLIELLKAGGRQWERRRLGLPPLPLGYHRFTLRFESGGAVAETPLIVAPARAYMPAPIEDGPGLWGIAVQLYALRSEHDWGIGDFDSLAEFIRGAAAAGAGAVGINPLHALYLDEPERASPYSPSSRLYLNPLYIAVPATPDFAESPDAQNLVAAAPFQSALRQLREPALVDYRSVADRKIEVLEILHRSFRRRHIAANSARGLGFADYRRSQGELLRRFCIFQALRETFGRRDVGQR